MGITVKVTGVKAAAAQVGASAAALVSAAESAVNQTAAFVRQRAVERTAAVYNLGEDTLSRYVFVRRASVQANLVRGSVELQLKAVPVSEFSPTVSLVSVRLSRAFGKPTRAYTRKLPQVRVALYKGRRARVLPGGFPLRQRSPGALAAGEAVRKRVGAGRGERRDGSVGNKLTGFRYFTFPKRVTDKLLPELQREAGKQLSVIFRTAYRVEARRQTALRRND